MHSIANAIRPTETRRPEWAVERPVNGAEEVRIHEDDEWQREVRQDQANAVAMDEAYRNMGASQLARTLRARR